MESVHFLNLEYFILRIYEIVTGVDVDVAEVPSTAMFVGGQVALAGMAISTFLLAAIVYFLIKLTIVEHKGIHEKHEKERPHQPDPTVNSKNPRWDRVMELASSGEEASWRHAIVEADIILADLLTDRGYRGGGVGEQLKDVNPLQFTTLDLAWKAHKMRNAVAHLGEAFPLTQRDAQTTIDQYAQVFREFDII